MKNLYSTEIAVSIFRFLCTDEWHFGFHGEDGVFHFGLSLSNKLKNVKFLVQLHESDYTVICICPKNADVEDKAQMAEIADFLHLANYNLRNGNFELDIQDGEIRFKSHVDCEGLTAPTADMVCNSIYVCGAMFKRYGDAICYIIEDGMTAKEAIVLCEGDRMESSVGEEDDIVEIIDDEDETPDLAPAEDASGFPDFDEFEDDDIADLLRMMQEMREND